MVITAKELADRRRYVIVAAFVYAAVVTPPEVLSQLSVAIPLVLFYEAAIAVLRWSENSQ